MATRSNDDVITVSMEFCTPGSDPWSQTQQYDRGVDYFRRYSKHMNDTADMDTDQHIIVVTMSDDGKVLDQNRVQCRHQKPFN